MFTDGEHKFKVRKRKFKAVEHKFIAYKHKIELEGNRKPSSSYPLSSHLSPLTSNETEQAELAKVEYI